jgi:predicted AlkP superfamily phosphohydrolase/phosphomutase
MTRRRPAACLAPVVALSLVAGIFFGCSPRPPAVLVMAIDGFEWDVLGPLVAAGEMPEFARLIEEGQVGRLSTTRPTFSPIIWTSIATSKPRSEHGIRGFVRRKPKEGGTRRLYNSLDRRTKAFWNVLSDYERSSAIVGWWMTYPVEPIDGVMVAQVNTLDQAKRRSGRAIIKGSLRLDVEGQIHPRDRTEEILDLHEHVVADLPRRLREIFGEVPRPTSELTERLWLNTQWAFRSDAAYLEIAEKLAAEGYDLVACYFGGADVAGHRFWRYMDPDAFEHPPSLDEIEAFGEVIPDYYRFLDRALGRLRSAMPRDANILVVTDHGMEAVNRAAEFDAEDLPDDVNSGHHHGAKAGVIVAAGPAFPGRDATVVATGAEELPVLASIYDITPTILALLGVPTGEDMQGRIMSSAAVPDPGTVPTHDTETWLSERSAMREEAVEDDPERLEQLKALGYIN